jgi:hypothetical protein
MAERSGDSVVSKGNRRAVGLATLLVLVAVGLSACGSETDTTTTAPPAVSRTTADELAKLSNRIASDLDAGDVCHAAHAADDLHAAVEESDLPPSMRPGVDEVATQLVNEVNCPPPPPPPEPPKEDKKGQTDNEHKQDKGDAGGKGDQKQGDAKSGPGSSGHSDHGGFVPPGQAKLDGG